MRSRIDWVFLVISMVCKIMLIVGLGMMIESDFSRPRDAYHECSVLESGVAYSEKSRSLCVKGWIDYRLHSDFVNYIKNMDSLGLSADYVVVSSIGGEIRPAMQMAKTIENKHIDVVVGDICSSSCAQLLFVAGENKYILKEGAVLFHGGAMSERDIDGMDIPPSAKDSLRMQNKEFENFYKERSIDLRVLTDPPEEVQNQIDSGDIVMWSWSQEMLERFGVLGVHQES